MTTTLTTSTFGLYRATFRDPMDRVGAIVQVAAPTLTDAFDIAKAWAKDRPMYENLRLGHSDVETKRTFSPDHILIGAWDYR